MYFLEVDMLLQFPPQCYFSAILSHRPIIHKEEMGMQAVENVQFAERIQQCLIWSNNLQCGKEQPLTARKVKVKKETIHTYIFICTHKLQLLWRINIQVSHNKLHLTSLPMRSFLFSITPQGAIPIVQIFFDDLEQCSLRASPTCFATPSETNKKSKLLFFL